MSKSPSKKTATTKRVETKVIKSKRTSALHEKLEKLFTRAGGCTMHDTYNAGFKYPAIQALKIFERRGYKVNVSKKPGELTVYTSKRGA